MVIKRTTNKYEIEIELTKQEMFEAYQELQAEWDVDYCHNYLLAYKGDTWYDNFTKEELTYIENFMAGEYRKNIDKCDMNEEYAASEAFDYTVQELGIQL